MPYLYLIASVLSASSATVFAGFFERHSENKKNASILYTALIALSASLFWIVRFCLDRTADPAVLPYSILFGTFYIICTVGLINATKSGPVVLTSLIVQLALIGTSVWGFFFWGDKFTPSVAVGLLLVVIALVLCLRSGKQEGGARINGRWILWASCAFFGNAGCAITQRTQQMNFDGRYGSFLMMIGSLTVVVLCLVWFLVSDKREIREVPKRARLFPLAAGFLNGFHNLFLILLASSHLSPSLIYPTLAIGSLMINVLFSAFVFKEKMRWWQWLGVAVGALATGILSL